MGLVSSDWVLGEATDLNESTGQVTFVMHELPQLPLGGLKLAFDGGRKRYWLHPRAVCRPSAAS
jgi:hypothetical protein